MYFLHYIRSDSSRACSGHLFLIVCNCPDRLRSFLGFIVPVHPRPRHHSIRHIRYNTKSYLGTNRRAHIVEAHEPNTGQRRHNHLPFRFRQDVLHSLLLPTLQTLQDGLDSRESSALCQRFQDGSNLPHQKAHRGQGYDLLSIVQV